MAAPRLSTRGPTFRPNLKRRPREPVKRFELTQARWTAETCRSKTALAARRFAFPYRSFKPPRTYIRSVGVAPSAFMGFARERVGSKPSRQGSSPKRNPLDTGIRLVAEAPTRHSPPLSYTKCTTGTQAEKMPGGAGSNEPCRPLLGGLSELQPFLQALEISLPNPSTMCASRALPSVSWSKSGLDDTTALMWLQTL